MLIALLAVPGVDLLVIVALFSRRRWVSHQPGPLKGAISVIDGTVPGLAPKWKRGYGRWVGDVLVWTEAPFKFHNELVPVGGLTDAVRTALPWRHQAAGDRTGHRAGAGRPGSLVLTGSAGTSSH